jgi:ribosome assembly protein RRB1
MAKRRIESDKDEMEKSQFGQRRLADDGDVEMGEFEDPWEDEIEDEEIIEADEDDEENEGPFPVNHLILEMKDINDESEVYLPSKPVEKDHVLMPDLSTYDMLHTMSVQWPFLSFDIIKDQLGDERRIVLSF